MDFNIRGFDVVSYDNDSVMVRCQKCGAVTIHLLAHIDSITHGQSCMVYYQNAIINGYGSLVYEVFSTIYRRTKNSCTDPDDEEYNEYGINHWGYEDFIDFMFSEFNNFIEVVKLYDIYTITLVRINRDRGYVRGNVRFISHVPAYRTRNNDRVRPVKSVNLETGEILEFPHSAACGLKLHIHPTRVWECCNKVNNVYKGYKFSYM